MIDLFNNCEFLIVSRRMDELGSIAPESQLLINMMPFTINGFVFSEIIGKGSFAIVFKVYNAYYSKDFAAKAIPIRLGEDEDQIDVCANEIEALKRLNHPNIIKLYDTFKVYNHLFMILQYCGKGTLDKMIRPPFGLPTEILIPYMRQILDAIEYSHKMNVAHRDIKPSNIFIDDNLRPLIADFGLSYIEKTKLELSKEYCGSYGYRSPEICTATPYCPFKADVWALGVTIYQMCTGRKPWPDGRNNKETLEAIQKAKFSIPDTIPTDVKACLKMMMIPDPKKRPTISQVKALDLFKPLSPIPTINRNSSRPNVSTPPPPSGIPRSTIGKNSKIPISSLLCVQTILSNNSRSNSTRNIMNPSITSNQPRYNV